MWESEKGTAWRRKYIKGVGEVAGRLEKSSMGLLVGLTSPSSRLNQNPGPPDRDSGDSVPKRALGEYPR